MFSLYAWIAAQIITESLPISSSSHLKILETILKNRGYDDFLTSLPRYFDDLIHIPTLFILFLFFYQRISIFLYHPWRCKTLIISSVLRTSTASGITVFFYVLFNFCQAYQYFPLPLGLAISALLLASVYWCSFKNEPYIFSKAVVLGIVQGFSLLPGISRLAFTYVAGRWLGLSSRSALEASFTIQVPLIIAASFRALLYALKSPYFYQLLNMQTCSVILIASAVSYCALCLVAYMARKNMIWLFACYMVVPLSVWIYLHA